VWCVRQIMQRGEIRKLRRELEPYVASITKIGGRTTQSVFDLVFEEEGKTIEFEEDDSWMARLLAKMIIDDLIAEQEHAKIPKNVTLEEQQIVETMATGLLQSLKMRSLVIENYAPSMMTEYLVSELVKMAINDQNLDRAIIAWRLLEDLTMRFGRAMRQLAPVFTLAREEVAESMDPGYATFVLIANLADSRVDQILLRIIGADDAQEKWWKP
jgi:hypothetical protein